MVLEELKLNLNELDKIELIKIEFQILWVETYPLLK